MVFLSSSISQVSEYFVSEKIAEVNNWIFERDGNRNTVKIT
jgi:hypothetical protein